MSDIDIDDLYEELNNGNNRKVNEDRHHRARHFYLKGKLGFPEEPSESLSERETGWYMMGYNYAEWEAVHNGLV